MSKQREPTPAMKKLMALPDLKRRMESANPYVTFEKGHMTVDILRYLRTPEGKAAMEAVGANVPMGPPQSTKMVDDYAYGINFIKRNANLLLDACCGPSEMFVVQSTIDALKENQP